MHVSFETCGLMQRVTTETITGTTSLFVDILYALLIGPLKTMYTTHKDRLYNYKLPKC